MKWGDLLKAENTTTSSTLPGNLAICRQGLQKVIKGLRLVITLNTC
jgi:hypothetical protein